MNIHTPHNMLTIDCELCSVSGQYAWHGSPLHSSSHRPMIHSQKHEHPGSGSGHNVVLYLTSQISHQDMHAVSVSAPRTKCV